jgi:uncharacterized repeat protein (TIGR01451 family)
MKALGRRVCLALLLAACVVTQPGCFGGMSNPSYFPNLIPPLDIIQTHAKPPGYGYFNNFDPYAVDIVVRPLDQTNPVRTQYVMIATVRDAKGQALRARRVEWMLEGVGHIVEVDESGCTPGAGYKVSDKYAVSYTNYHEHDFNRGNKNPNDDFSIRPGQTWCVVTSPIEGDTHMTVYAPEIFNWDKGRIFVSCKWVDVNWTFPPPATVPAGTPYVVTTHIVRHTDQQPLANYRVRYTILDDDPPVVFSHSRTKEAVVSSDLAGNASATLLQTLPRSGLTHLAIEVIRPPDPTSPSGVGVTLARGDTTVEWLAPAINLSITGPPSGSVGGELNFTTTIANGGRAESRSMTVTQPIPEGLKYVRSTPDAIVDGKQLVWTMGRLPPGQNHVLQSVYVPLRPGQFTCCSNLVTEEGIRDSKCATTDASEPRLRVTMTGPATGQVGAPFNYQINVINEGVGTLSNVVVTATFDKGLKHAALVNSMVVDPFVLGARENRPLPPLQLTPTQAGQFTTRVSVKADGGLSDKTEQTISIQQPQLGVKLVGPQKKYVGWPADWEIRVTNEGDVALSGVEVRNLLPPELTAQTWSDGGKAGTGEVVWNVGELKPREQRTLAVKTRCEKLINGAVNRVTASAGGVTADDQVSVDIFGLPGLQLEVIDRGDPVQVGKTVQYVITVTNTGTSPAAGIEIKAKMPKELQILQESIKGPTAPSVVGQEVTFGRLESLGAGQKAEYLLDARGLEVGDVRFRVEMRSPTLTSGQPVIKEESTHVIPALQSER